MRTSGNSLSFTSPSAWSSKRSAGRRPSWPAPASAAPGSAAATKPGQTIWYNSPLSFGAPFYTGTGVGTTGTGARTGTFGTGTTGTGTQGHDVSGPTTDDAMTRSEERLHVGTETVPAGRARLRKYVVTENVTQTVPVSHEEVRVEREPITEANVDAAMSGPDISEEEHEVTLRAERPVVAKEAVPVERVRLSTETVTEEHEVNEQVRKEQIEEPEIDPGTPGPGH